MNEGNGNIRFVVCVNNDDYPASLEVRKLYHTVEDKEAERHNFLRVVDESGEDYLYPAHYFMALPLPGEVEEALTNLPSFPLRSLDYPLSSRGTPIYRSDRKEIHMMTVKQLMLQHLDWLSRNIGKDRPGLISFGLADYCQRRF